MRWNHRISNDPRLVVRGRARRLAGARFLVVALVFRLAIGAAGASKV
jgi:hypothetical protein